MKTSELAVPSLFFFFQRKKIEHSKVFKRFVVKKMHFAKPRRANPDYSGIIGARAHIFVMKVMEYVNVIMKYDISGNVTLYLGSFPGIYFRNKSNHFSS